MKETKASNVFSKQKDKKLLSSLSSKQHLNSSATFHYLRYKKGSCSDWEVYRRASGSNHHLLGMDVKKLSAELTIKYMIWALRTQSWKALKYLLTKLLISIVKFVSQTLSLEMTNEACESFGRKPSSVLSSIPIRFSFASKLSLETCMLWFAKWWIPL